MSPKQLFIISGKNPITAGSGYAAYSYNLAKIATDLKIPVTIFCAGDKANVENTRVGRIITVSSPFWTWFAGAEMASLVFFAPTVAKEIVKNLDSGKVIIWGAGPWSLAGAIVKVFKPVTLLADYHTTFRHEFAGTVRAMTIQDYGFLKKLSVVISYLTVIPTYGLLERWLLHMTDKIVTHYDSTEEILRSEMDVADSKFVRLPYRVEAARNTTEKKFKPLKFSPPLILLVCRHDGRKGINYLLKACKILQDQNSKFQLVIIGKGRLLQTHQALVKKLGLKNVQIGGYIADLRPYLSDASVYVFPSVEEGSSALSILEAMQWGCPIVCTKIDGLQEDLQDNKSALLVPPQNPQALADAMKKLLQNKSLAKRLGSAARQRYHTLYNEQRVKKEIGQFLNDL